MDCGKACRMYFEFTFIKYITFEHPWIKVAVLRGAHTIYANMGLHASLPALLSRLILRLTTLEQDSKALLVSPA
jgi:hypothetical protein